MNCPACAYYNPAGAQTCFHCGLVLPIAAAVDAACPRHPEVQATGACSRCGTFGCGQCLVQHGEQWLCPDCELRVGTLPWDERETIGVWRAWWRTCLKMIATPSQTLRHAKPGDTLGSSMLFSTLSALVNIVPTMLVMLVVVGATSMFVKSEAAPSKVLLFGIVFGEMIFIVIATSLSALLVAGLDHLCLKLVGANPKTFDVTLRAYALASAPSLLGLIPVCGLYVTPIWSLVLRIVANVELHKTSGGKATLAILLPVIGFCGLGIALYMSIVGMAALSSLR